jgi:adenine-specific DNA-methyltransferase
VTLCTGSDSETLAFGPTDGSDRETDSMFASSQVRETFSADSRLVVLEADTLDACRELPREFFSLIITSPPYNIGKSYESQTELQRYLEWQEAVIRELVALLRPTGSLCWQVGNYVEAGEVFPLDMFFYPIFKKLGLQLRNRVIWHFEHGLHASRRFSGRYETLLWFTKSNEYVFNLDPVRVPSKYPGKTHYKGEKYGQPSGNPLGKNPSDLWRFLADEWEEGVWEIPNVKSNHPEKTVHPCQFPIELVERCVLAFTNEDDWVLDPFAGVGSTLIAAAKHNRRSVGIDRDREYCAVARSRISAYLSGTLRIRPLGKPVHQPSGREKVAQVPLEWPSAKESRS